MALGSALREWCRVLDRRSRCEMPEDFTADAFSAREREPSYPADLIVDALIGYSLSGAPTGGAGEMIDWANASPAPVLALDLPSGIDSSTGESFGTAIPPEWTMTLALPKTGLTPERTGALYLADIGVP